MSSAPGASEHRLGNQQRAAGQQVRGGTPEQLRHRLIIMVVDDANQRDQRLPGRQRIAVKVTGMHRDTLLQPGLARCWRASGATAGRSLSASCSCG